MYTTTNDPLITINRQTGRIETHAGPLAAAKAAIAAATLAQLDELEAAIKIARRDADAYLTHPKGAQ